MSNTNRFLFGVIGGQEAICCAEGGVLIWRQGKQKTLTSGLAAVGFSGTERWVQRRGNHGLGLGDGVSVEVWGQGVRDAPCLSAW